MKLGTLVRPLPSQLIIPGVHRHGDFAGQLGVLAGART